MSKHSSSSVLSLFSRPGCQEVATYFVTVLRKMASVRDGMITTHVPWSMACSCMHAKMQVANSQRSSLHLEKLDIFDSCWIHGGWQGLPNLYLIEMIIVRFCISHFDSAFFGHLSNIKINVEFSNESLFCKSNIMCFHFVSSNISNILSRALFLADSNEPLIAQRSRAKSASSKLVASEEPTPWPSQILCHITLFSQPHR